MEITEIGLLAIKAETTNGTDPVPTAAANSIRAVSDALSWNVASTPVERRILDGTLDRLVGFNAMPNVTLKFRYEIGGNYTTGATDTDISSGDAAQALKIDPILQAANLNPVYTPETTNGARDGYVTYTPKAFTTIGPSVTAYWWTALKLHKLIGGKVNIDKMTFEAGKIGIIDFSIMGKYAAVTDVTLPTTQDWAGQEYRPPAFTPSSLSIGSYTAAVVGTIEVELGNVIAMRPDALSSNSLAAFVITDFIPKARINPESVAVATSDFWGDWAAGTMRNIGFAYGLLNGNRFSLQATCEMKSINYADANKIRVHQIELNVVKTALSYAAGGQLQLKWY